MYSTTVVRTYAQLWSWYSNYFYVVSDPIGREIFLSLRRNLVRLRFEYDGRHRVEKAPISDSFAARIRLTTAPLLISELGLTLNDFSAPQSNRVNRDPNSLQVLSKAVAATYIEGTDGDSNPVQRFRWAHNLSREAT